MKITDQVPKKEVVAVLILGIDEIDNRYLLIDCDVGNRHPFRFIGGKIDESDNTPQSAIIREVNEEIGLNTCPDVISIPPNPMTVIRTRKISGSTDLPTDYVIHVFTPLSFSDTKLFSYSGDCGQRILWMKESTFFMLYHRVSDLFFRQTITDDVLRYITGTKVLYPISSKELSYSF